MTDAPNPSQIVRLRALAVKLCCLGGGSVLERVELLLVVADPERGDNLHHPQDDQPDADHECQCDKRIRWRRQHDEAGEDRDDAEEDAHPCPGRCGSLIAATVVATPRNTNPTPIQMASSRIA